MFLLKRYLFVLVFLHFSLRAYLQPNFTDNLHLGLNYQYGYVIPEYKNLVYTTNDYVRSLDITLYKKTRGSDYWQRIYNYPEFGFSLFYTTLGNKEMHGNEYALNYFFRLPFLIRNKWNLYNRTSIGIGYVTEKFDLETNFLNVSVGSNLNIHFNTRVGGQFSITDRLSLNSGISFDHFSYGNTSEPNLGINFVTGYAGLNYRIGEDTELLNPDLPDIEKENYWTIFYSIGGKHTRALASGYFFTTSLSLEFHRAVFRATHFGIGIDGFYDSSVESSFLKLQRNYEPYYDYQTGIHISQTFIYNRISLTFQEGIYVGLKERFLGKPMYNRGIVKFDVTPNFSVRMAMKSHLYILDYPEIGIGYKF